MLLLWNLVDVPLSNEYIAGLFDGEGYFTINRCHRSDIKREWSFQASARITIREGWLLKSIQDQFGGSLKETKKKSEKHSTYFLWSVGDKKMLRFLDQIGPLLVLKRQHFLVVDSFVRMKVNHGFGPLDDFQYEARENSFFDLRELNRRGVDRVLT